MDGAGIRGVEAVKGRIALFAGYFVGALLVASWFTGVLQEGVIATLLRSSDPLRHDPTPAVSENEGGVPPLVTGQVERATASPPQDQATHDPDRGELQQNAGPGERPQIDPKGSLELDTVNRALEAKRAELNHLEALIRRQKEQNMIEAGQLAKRRAFPTTMMGERDTRREAGIMKLAKLYEGMEPETAASILSSLEKDLATRVLASMKDRQASKVLGAMNGRRARELSERLHEVRSNRSNTGELNEQGDSVRKDVDADL